MDKRISSDIRADILAPEGERESVPQRSETGRGIRDFRVSVIIVSYNTRELTLRAIDGIAFHHEVIVVDNNSTDGTPEAIEKLYPRVKLIRSPENVGFGSGCNLGLDAMEGDFALLLNSDAVPLGDAIDILADTLEEDDRIAACGGQLLNPDGSVQNSCSTALTLWCVFCEQWLLEKLMPWSRLFSPYWQTQRLLDPEYVYHRVGQVMGACLMMRPVERFDEDFFLYCEDTELCHRLWNHGMIMWVRTAVFEHELGASSDGTRWEAVARYNYGKELYFRKHFGRWKSLICLKLNRQGAFIRLLIWGLPTLFTLGLIPRFRSQALLWIRVLFAPISGPADPRSTRR